MDERSLAVMNELRDFMFERIYLGPEQRRHRRRRSTSSVVWWTTTWASRGDTVLVSGHRGRPRDPGRRLCRGHDRPLRHRYPRAAVRRSGHGRSGPVADGGTAHRVTGDPAPGHRHGRRGGRLQRRLDRALQPRLRCGVASRPRGRMGRAAPADGLRHDGRVLGMGEGRRAERVPRTCPRCPGRSTSSASWRNGTGSSSSRPASTGPSRTRSPGWPNTVCSRARSTSRPPSTSSRATSTSTTRPTRSRRSRVSGRTGPCAGR